MTTIRFQEFHATKKVSFTCQCCKKVGRVRTFRDYCTVNPFNTNERGEVRTPTEVRAQAAERVKRVAASFMVKPLCKTCEDGLSYLERRALAEERRAGVAA